MKSMTRAVGALALTGLVASSAFAADTTKGALPAGKPAGVTQASMQGNGLVWLGAAAVIALAVVAISSNGDDGVTTPTTSATGTSA